MAPMVSQATLASTQGRPSMASKGILSIVAIFRDIHFGLAALGTKAAKQQSHRAIKLGSDLNSGSPPHNL